MIYHVTDTNSWAKALQDGAYSHASLPIEGFIHCSTKNQVAGVLERYYQGQSNLLLLHIDESLLIAPLKYENAPSVNEDFPHVFGCINLNAVVSIETILQ
jgi:uncharacterized protein (DUF952 family)